VAVTAAVGKLAPGAYSGAVVFSANAQNSPVTVPVGFQVREPRPAALEVSTTALRFTAVAGGRNPPGQEIGVGNLGEIRMNWRASVSTTSGGAWLSAGPASGTDAGRVTVQAEIGTLDPGEYRGLVRISSDEAVNSPLDVPVTLTVERAAPLVTVSAEQLRFAAGPDSFRPPAQALGVSNGGVGTLNWRAAAATFNGGAWLVATPGSGTGAGTVTLEVDATGLTSGAYTGRISLAAEGAPNSPLHIPVSLTVTRRRPEFRAEAVVNAASLRPGPVAAEEILTIFGERLGPGARVKFDGAAGRVLYSSYAQLNVAAPPEVEGKARVRMVVEVDGLDAAEMELPAARAAPGMFTIDGERAAVAESPVEVGGVVQMFGTGLRGEVVVLMNTIDAVVRYAGPAPGLIGVQQVNAEVPLYAGVSDRVRVVVRAGGVEAPPVFIAVRPLSGSPPP